ncbi:hypothetical protein [Cupriavidus basilensis]|uniref:hypothetical protein n=1 Tax=Cupriavidus basilensis TaxID=68895 RepID=UPI0039F69BB6
MLRTAFGGFLLCLLGACATSPVTQGQATAVPADRLYLYQGAATPEHGSAMVTRDTGFVGNGCFLGLYVDGDLAGKFETGETAAFQLPQGEHILGIAFPPGKGLCAFHDGERREISAVIAPGKTKYFRLVVRPGDGPTIEPTTVR